MGRSALDKGRRCHTSSSRGGVRGCVPDIAPTAHCGSRDRRRGQVRKRGGLQRRLRGVYVALCFRPCRVDVEIKELAAYHPLPCSISLLSLTGRPFPPPTLVSGGKRGEYGVLCSHLGGGAECVFLFHTQTLSRPRSYFDTLMTWAHVPEDRALDKGVPVLEAPLAPRPVPTSGRPPSAGSVNWKGAEPAWGSHTGYFEVHVHLHLQRVAFVLPHTAPCALPQYRWVLLMKRQTVLLASNTNPAPRVH